MPTPPVLTSFDGTLSLAGEYRVPFPDEDNQFLLPWLPDLHGTCVGFRFPQGGRFGVDGMSTFKVVKPNSDLLNLHEILVLLLNMAPDGRTAYPLRRHHTVAGGGVRYWSLPMGSIVVPPNGVVGLWGNGWMDKKGKGWNFDGNPFETSAVLLGEPGVQYVPLTAVMPPAKVKGPLGVARTPPKKGRGRKG